MLTGTPARKRPLGRLQAQMEDNIIIELKEIGINTENWVDSSQDRDYQGALVNAAMKLQIP